jgi:hypothetical protein
MGKVVCLVADPKQLVEASKTLKVRKWHVAACFERRGSAHSRLRACNTHAAHAQLIAGQRQVVELVSGTSLPRVGDESERQVTASKDGAARQQLLLQLQQQQQQQRAAAAQRVTADAAEQPLREAEHQLALGGSRGSGRAGKSVRSAAAPQSAAQRDALSQLDGVLRMWRARVAASSEIEAEKQLLRVSLKELEAFVTHDTAVPQEQRDEFMSNLESFACGGTLCWASSSGKPFLSRGELWDAELSTYGLLPQSPAVSLLLPYWTDLGVFEDAAHFGSEDAAAAAANIAADVAGQDAIVSGVRTAVLVGADRPGRTAWQRLWVDDDADVVVLKDGSSDATAARDLAFCIPSSLDGSHDADETPAAVSRALQMRTQLLSTGTARRRALDTLLEMRLFDDAAALVLEPPPAAVTHLCACTHEIAMLQELSGEYPPPTVIHHTLMHASSTRVHPAFTVVCSHCCDVDDIAAKLPLTDLGTEDEFDDLALEDDRVRKDLEMLNGLLAPLDADAEKMPYPTWETAWTDAPEDVLKQKVANLLSQPELKPVEVEGLNANDKAIMTDLAVHNVLTGLRILTENGLLPVRCVREVKRYLTHCLGSEAAEQPLHVSLRQLSLLDLVALSRYVSARYQHRAPLMEHWLEYHELAITLSTHATPFQICAASDGDEAALVLSQALLRRLSVSPAGREHGEAAGLEDVIRSVLSPDPAVYRCVQRGVGVQRASCRACNVASA